MRGRGVSRFLGFIVFVMTIILLAPLSIYAATRYEENDPSVTYSGTWGSASNPDHSGGTAKYSNNAGDYAEFTFSGTSVTWIANTRPDRGIAKVYIDGTYEQDVDLYDSVGAFQQAVYSISGLTNTTHTLKIEVTDQKNPASANYYIVIDAFDVGIIDSTPPSDPTNLVASAVSSDQIDLSWTASTDDTGVAGYRVVRSTDGVTFFEVGTSSANSYSDTGLNPSTTYYYRVRAYDAAGNHSGYSNISSATTTAPPSVNRYEETDAAINYTGTWQSWYDSGLSGGSEAYSSELGAEATMNFYGNSITWIANKAGSRGIAKVYIDGIYDTDVDLYNSTRLYQQEVYTKSGLTSGLHNLRIEVTDNKNPDSSGYNVGIDAFDVESLPDTTPPSAPSNLTAIALSTSEIDLSWDPASDNKGVTGYKLERSLDGTSFTEIGTSTTTSYSDTGLAPATTYYYRVRAYDAAGNNGEYSNTTSAVTQTPPETIRYENTHSAIAYTGTGTFRSEDSSPDITYTGTWNTASNTNHSGGTAKWSDTAGDFAEFTFTSASIAWIANTRPDRGIAKVYIDDVYQQDVDLYDPVGAFRQVVYSNDTLTNTTHTIRIEVTDQKNPSSANYYIIIDAFDITGDAWQEWADPSLSSGSETWASALGAIATFSFSGTDVFWIAARGPNRGIAKVYIDDVYEQDIDLYSSATVYQDVVFSKSGLSDSSHSLKVEVVRTKNASSSGYRVGIDAFDVVVPPVTILTTVQTDPERADAYGTDGYSGWFRVIPTITLNTNVTGTTYYQWDSTAGSWIPYTGPFSGLDGVHTLYFYTEDTVGTMEPEKIKRFKVDTTIPPVGTHAGCEGCHGAGSTYAGGDHETYWTGTPHDTALSTQPAGCIRCHSWDSTLSKLIRSPIPDTTGEEHIVLGNDNTLCGACHSAANYAYSGMTMFQGTKHFQTASSYLALNTYPDAGYLYGMCGNCHNPHGVAGASDYTRASGNTLCTNCHDDSALPSKPQKYSYQGYTSYSSAEHGSGINSYNIWPNANETGAGIGSGGATSGQCINCHNPHGKAAKQTNAEGENLCYGGSGTSGGCHTADTGSSTGRNIYNEFTASSDSAAHHSLDDTEQSSGGSKVECVNCHNSHLNTATNMVANPDDKSLLYTLTMTDPKDGSTVLNYVGFCDKCHNGFPPEGVTVPGTMINVKKNYESDPPDVILGGIDETGDWHGVKSGTGWGGTLQAPYSRGMAALVCTDCHESHGSSNIYHFKETVNGKTGISVTDISGKGADALCTACHSTDYHEGCLTYDCHSVDPVPPTVTPPGTQTPCFYCHNHEGIKNWPYPQSGHVLETGCEHCHQYWYPYDSQ